MPQPVNGACLLYIFSPQTTNLPISAEQTIADGLPVFVEAKIEAQYCVPANANLVRYLQGLRYNLLVLRPFLNSLSEFIRQVYKRIRVRITEMWGGR